MTSVDLESKVEALQKQLQAEREDNLRRLEELSSVVHSLKRELQAKDLLIQHLTNRERERSLSSGSSSSAKLKGDGTKRTQSKAQLTMASRPQSQDATPPATGRPPLGTGTGEGELHQNQQQQQQQQLTPSPSGSEKRYQSGSDWDQTPALKHHYHQHTSNGHGNTGEDSPNPPRPDFDSSGSAPGSQKLTAPPSANHVVHSTTAASVSNPPSQSQGPQPSPGRSSAAMSMDEIPMVETYGEDDGDSNDFTQTTRTSEMTPTETTPTKSEPRVRHYESRDTTGSSVGPLGEPTSAATGKRSGTFKKTRQSVVSVLSDQVEEERSHYERATIMNGRQKVRYPEEYVPAILEEQKEVERELRRRRSSLSRLRKQSSARLIRRDSSSAKSAGTCSTPGQAEGEPGNDSMHSSSNGKSKTPSESPARNPGDRSVATAEKSRPRPDAVNVRSSSRNTQAVVDSSSRKSPLVGRGVSPRPTEVKTNRAGAGLKNGSGNSGQVVRAAPNRSTLTATRASPLRKETPLNATPAGRATSAGRTSEGRPQTASPRGRVSQQINSRQTSVESSRSSRSVEVELEELMQTRNSLKSRTDALLRQLNY